MKIMLLLINALIVLAVTFVLLLAFHRMAQLENNVLDHKNLVVTVGIDRELLIITSILLIFLFALNTLLIALWKKPSGRGDATIETPVSGNSGQVSGSTYERP